MDPSGGTAELHTRCQPQQKSGGSSWDPEPQPGTKEEAEEGQRAETKEVGGHSERKEAEKVPREKRKNGGAEGRRDWKGKGRVSG
jgi:hypothetical protein